jgi:translation initiation factor 3 subunit F
MLSSPLIAGQGSKKYFIHPLVLCSIYDNFARRKENQNRIIGTLVGEHYQGDIIIKDCFPVPYNDDKDRVEVDIEFHQTMFELHHQINPTDVIVGWFATGDESWSDDVVIHDFYSKNIVKKPVFLSVGTDLVNGAMEIKGFVQKKLNFGETQVGYHFKRVDLQYKQFESEKIAINKVLKAEKNEPIDLSQDDKVFTQTMKKLSTMLSELEVFVNKSQTGKISPKEEQVLKILNGAFTDLMSSGITQNVLDKNIADMKMIVSLTKSLQSHLVLSEKLQNSM